LNNSRADSAALVWRGGGRLPFVVAAAVELLDFVLPSRGKPGPAAAISPLAPDRRVRHRGIFRDC